MKRYDLIDSLRGLSVISMIGFHACWLISYFGLGISSQTLFGTAFTVWERSICMSFILIAGFSFSLGRDHLKSGLIIFGLGAAITAVTCLFLPDIRIIFGILTFIGTSILLMIPVDKKTERSLSWTMSRKILILAIIMVLFVLTYNINKGYIGFAPDMALVLPKGLYRGYVATFFGFMDPGFYSSDYFSLIPWFFLYVFGYFLHKTVIGSRFESVIQKGRIPGINIIGRHSLVIYILHPIILYLILYVLSLKMR